MNAFMGKSDGLGLQGRIFFNSPQLTFGKPWRIAKGSEGIGHRLFDY